MPVFKAFTNAAEGQISPDITPKDAGVLLSLMQETPQEKAFASIFDLSKT